MASSLRPKAELADRPRPLDSPRTPLRRSLGQFQRSAREFKGAAAFRAALGVNFNLQFA
jgi:hypothetical protein